MYSIVRYNSGTEIQFPCAYSTACFAGSITETNSASYSTGAQANCRFYYGYSLTKAKCFSGITGGIETSVIFIGY